MSVEKLKLGIGANNLNVYEKDNEIFLDFWNEKQQRGMPAVLDRNQAHYLMLWLQEHLK